MALGERQNPAKCPEAGGRSPDAGHSMLPIYRVTVMSWCFHFLLDLLWVPLVAFFRDMDLSLHMLGAVFALNCGARIIPNAVATKLGVKTDLVCMLTGLMCFAVNFVWPTETWAIFVMSAGGGMTFVRAHLSVHGKKAVGSSIEKLTLAAKWSGAARNAGTAMAFMLPVVIYNHFGWRAVIAFAMVVMSTYVVLATAQQFSTGGPKAGAADEKTEQPAVLIESTTGISTVPWIDWVVAGAFCVTELQFNLAAAAVPTTLMKTFDVPVPLIGVSQSAGQLIAMGALMVLSRGFCKLMQKRPLNMLLSFLGTFVTMSVIWATASFMRSMAWLFIVALYLFYVSAYTAQVTMLECLTGVLDMQSSIVVMGYSEMVGCAFSLVGGYLGPALLTRDPAAPFALQGIIALVTTVVLALALGHRATTQTVVCQTEDEYVDSLEDTINRRPSLKNSFQGLHMMAFRKETYIKVEQMLRAQGVRSPVPTAREAEDCHSQQDKPASWPEAQGGLTKKLLEKQSQLPKVELPMPDHVASTLKARQFKKAMVSFALSYLDLDTKDHQVQIGGSTRLVATKQPSFSHQSVRSGGV